MSKKQINVSADYIKALIREELDSLGNKRYPEGVFSTDSEEGEDYKKNDYQVSNLWKDTWHHLEDSPEKLDKIARDKYGEDEKMSNMYYENPEGEENLYFGDPDLEQDDDEEDIAGINEVKLNEQQLREFISYSVAKLLKEWRNGGTTIELDPWEDNFFMRALESVLEASGEDSYDFAEKYSGIWPLEVEIDFSEDDPDPSVGYGGDIDIIDSRIVSEVPQEVSGIIEKAVEKYMANDVVYNKIEDSLNGYSPDYEDDDRRAINESLRLNEKNLGITTHFDGKSEREATNPYMNMTWDEYCAAKAGESEKDKEREMRDAEVKDEEPNRGIMAHFDDKEYEKTPEDIERSEHMFDDKYWANKMNLSEADIREMVETCVKKLTEAMGMDNEPKSKFPDRASGTFTEKYGQRSVKCRAIVQNNNDGSITMAILMYGDEGWEPEMEWMFDVEEYVNGEWLPYWETFGGDSSMKSFRRFWPKFVKLLMKIGYRADEDNEVPFM